MVKKIGCVMAVAVSFLVGCSSGTEAPALVEVEEIPVVSAPVVLEEAPPEEMAVLEVAKVDSMQAVANSVYLEPMVHTDSLYADDDPSVLLARYEYNLLSMEPTDPEDEGAVALCQAFNAQFDMWEEGNDFAQMAAWAQEEYETTKDSEWGWTGYYTYEINTTVYQMAGLISLEGVYYSYTGGAHGNSVLLSWLFDLTTGTFVSPLCLAKDPQMFADAVAEELIAYIQSNTLEDLPLEEIYWDDYQTVVSSWDSYCVYFDEEGMHVSFSPYELAAYAAGPQEFTIAYETIVPYLSDGAVQMLQVVE